jgi:hypothetical protein
MHLNQTKVQGEETHHRSSLAETAASIRHQAKYLFDISLLTYLLSAAGLTLTLHCIVLAAALLISKQTWQPTNKRRLQT